MFGTDVHFHLLLTLSRLNSERTFLADVFPKVMSEWLKQIGHLRYVRCTEINFQLASSLFKRPFDRNCLVDVVMNGQNKRTRS